jgi:hypothetical protein
LSTKTSTHQVNQIYRIFEEFQPLETLVSSVRNSSFKGLKPKVSLHETDFGTTSLGITERIVTDVTANFHSIKIEI